MHAKGKEKGVQKCQIYLIYFTSSQALAGMI